MHSCPECDQACYCHGDIDDIDANEEPPFCDHCADRYDEEDDEDGDNWDYPEDDEEDPADEMPCGLCPVCDDPVDHSDAGFCVHCGLAFHWSGCGQWHDDQHTCNNCKPKDD